jgi:protein-arginine kinase activator protein McsA
MLCELCHQRQAAVHITTIMPGKPERQRHFCKICLRVPDGEPDAEQLERALRLLGNQWPDGSTDQNPNPNDMA